MIGGNITSSKTGEPLDKQGNALSVSAYNPPEQIKKLFARVQNDYQVAWSLQNRPFDEFDGYSLLQRASMDQQTFGAYVGASQDAIHLNWRWKGRKNTARNKVIGMLAHVVAGMLFPYCYATDEQNEEDKETAKVMRILIEDHLRKADYEIKFLFMMTSALVNPAVFVEVSYVTALQTIKSKLADGTYKVEQAVDSLLSGINLDIIPIDSLLLGDFFTFDLQKQPFILRIKRIPYDQAREIYAKKYFIDGEDQFDYVQAGKTRVVISGQDNQTLYDIDWTEADKYFVQVITAYYRQEDLEVDFVGGVFMGESKDIYNSNPFKHRRMSLLGNEWKTIPVYPFAKGGFEPLDPAGRFAYYKSACFKEFWDDAAQNRMHQLAYDGTYLDVIKPIMVAGMAQVDGTVMIPGAVVGMPMGATMTPYQLGPNLQAALNMMRVEQEDLSDSTQSDIMSGTARPGVTAYATSKAEQNAKVIMQVFSVFIVDLVKQIGDLTTDEIIAHTTVGEIDATIPEAILMKFKKITSRGKENGKDVTNNIEFSNDIMGISPEQANELEWDMFEKAGGVETTQRNYKVNPYKFARFNFSVHIDPDVFVSRSMGTDQLQKDRAYNMLMDPRVMPYVNVPAVIDKYILEEFSDGNPDQFKKDPQDILSQVMGQGQPGVPMNQPPTPQMA